MKNKYLFLILAIFVFVAILSMPLKAFCKDSAIDNEDASRVNNQSKPQEKEDNQTRLIALVFRISAKGLVSVSDMEKLKKTAIERIDKMDKSAFHARYMDFYEHVYDYPFFTVKYRLYKELSKDEAIEKIKKLDKQQAYLIIDSLPDIVISNEFKRRFFKKQEQIPNGNDMTKFFDSMGKWINEIKKKYLGQ
jgi:formate dehydrogenase maturation protein FdhE